MKKNKMMRLASGLLVATLLTTSMISGTFAKYVTSDSAEDSARVAKWGVTVDVVGEGAFATAYGADDTVVAVDAADATVITNGLHATINNLVAPGTEGPLASVAITGKPEVDVTVDVVADLTLTGWNITGDWDENPETDDTTIFYCPLEFLVNGVVQVDGKQFQDNADGLKAAVEALFNEDSAVINANTELATDYDSDVTWKWSYSGGSDVKDTALGDLNVAPTVELSVNATVTQVD